MPTDGSFAKPPEVPIRENHDLGEHSLLISSTNSFLSLDKEVHTPSNTRRTRTSHHSKSWADIAKPHVPPSIPTTTAPSPDHHTCPHVHVCNDNQSCTRNSRVESGHQTPQRSYSSSCFHSQPVTTYSSNLRPRRHRR